MATFNPKTKRYERDDSEPMDFRSYRERRIKPQQRNLDPHQPKKRK